MPRTPLVGALLCALLALSLPAATPAHAGPLDDVVDLIEDYASYQPATTCSPRAKVGTQLLGRHLVRKYGGGFGPISRPCGGSTSEHTEGRAFDWTLDASSRSGRRAAKAFLERIRRTDRHGNTDALARRMGIMYVIWDDRMYSAWDGFRPERYLSSGCTSRKKCSTTLRHRDHVHISLTRRAARARTSWYVAR